MTLFRDSITVILYSNYKICPWIGLKWPHTLLGDSITLTLAKFSHRNWQQKSSNSKKKTYQEIIVDQSIEFKLKLKQDNEQIINRLRRLMS